jgi:hypothetical protein
VEPAQVLPLVQPPQRQVVKYEVATLDVLWSDDGWDVINVARNKDDIITVLYKLCGPAKDIDAGPSDMEMALALIVYGHISQEFVAGDDTDLTFEGDDGDFLVVLDYRTDPDFDEDDPTPAPNFGHGKPLFYLYLVAETEEVSNVD